ncbi:HTH-type transcriptional activator RhaR [Paraliobacillus ryukyuensis]|uniref:Two-component system response regulator YesN n=1 Tax=Paraliobacillus ryukyuensis TaxID=200904 RepID=A0A366EFH5_9BACI|nr:response regulator [Paraliobacillus ryukyuensis]RBP00776.1 two-component system response regulator YesN [Paraliobacillus ryukyuensis]
MYEVLLIDNEPMIREGLKHIIDWNEYGFSICCDAIDGRDGLQKIRTHQPDLALVDIRMPGLSGIEMIQQAIQEGYQTKFIILSGYSSFSYAQQLIKLGITSYLLKPIDEEELINLLIGIKQTFEKERNINHQLKQYKQLSEEQTWHMLLEGKMIGKATSDLPAHIRNHTNYQLVMMLKRDLSNNAISPSFFNEITNPNVKLLSDSNRWFFLFMDFQEDEIIRYLQKLFIKLKNQPNVYLSHDFQALDLLPEAIHQMEQLQQLAFVYGNKTFILQKQLENKGWIELDIDTLIEPILKALEFQDIALLQSQWKTLIRYFQAQAMDQTVIQAELVDFFIQLNRAIKHAYPDVTVMDKNEVIESIYRSSNLQAIIERIELKLWHIAKHMDGFLLNADNNMDKIIHYIHHYYNQEINLKVLANLFNYNSSYLGKKFKKHTGYYFHTYLDQVRIEQAKQLLQTKEYKVYEISERIGYSNMDYFYKKFKKYVGMSPKTYQKKYKLQENDAFNTQKCCEGIEK